MGTLSTRKRSCSSIGVIPKALLLEGKKTEIWRILNEHLSVKKASPSTVCGEWAHFVVVYKPHLCMKLKNKM